MAGAANDGLKPDLIVGSSRNGAVAMNMDGGETTMILHAPAWRRWGEERSVKKTCVVIHSPLDEYVRFEDSVELCGTSAAEPIAAGEDHRMNR